VIKRCTTTHKNLRRTWLPHGAQPKNCPTSRCSVLEHEDRDSWVLSGEIRSTPRQILLEVTCIPKIQGEWLVIQSGDNTGALERCFSSSFGAQGCSRSRHGSSESVVLVCSLKRIRDDEQWRYPGIRLAVHRTTPHERDCESAVVGEFEADGLGESVGYIRIVGGS